MVRIASLGYGGKLEVDLRKNTFTAFGLFFMDRDWGLGQCSITQDQADALRLPLARAYLWEFDPTGAKFKPARRWCGETGFSLLVITWENGQKVFETCSRIHMESVPDSLRPVYELFNDTCGRLGSLALEFWPRPYEDRKPRSAITDVASDDPRRAEFNKEVHDAYLKSLPRDSQVPPLLP